MGAQLDVDDERATSCSCSSIKPANGSITSSARHCSSTPSDVANALRPAPLFEIWRARSLAGQDLLCAVFLLMTFLVFLYTTRPSLCSIGPAVTSGASIALPGGFEASAGVPISALYPSHVTQQVAAGGAVAQCHSSVSVIVTHMATEERSGLAPQAACDSIAAGRNGLTTWPLGWQLMCCHSNSSAASSAAKCAAQQDLSRLPGFWLIKPLQAAHNKCMAAATASGSKSGVGAGAILQCNITRVSLRLATKVAKVFLHTAQFTTVLFSWGWLTHDLVYVVLPILRLSMTLLLLLPIPIINPAAVAALIRKLVLTGSSPRHSSSSSSLWIWYTPNDYWRHPRFRQAVVICQRLLVHAAAAASVGRVDMRFWQLSSLRFWPEVSMYMYEGWVAWMLMLPMKLHLAVNFVEWLLVYSTAYRVWTMYHSSSSSSVIATTAAAVGTGSSSSIFGSSMLAFEPTSHFFISLVCVMVLPTMGVHWLDKVQKARYAQLYGRPAAAAALGDGLHMDDIQQQEGRGCCSCSTYDEARPEGGGSSSSHAVPSSLDSSSGSGASSSSSISDDQLQRDINTSLQLAASRSSSSVLDIPGDLHGSYTPDLDMPMSTAADGVGSGSSASRSSSVESMRQLVPALRGLLPDDDVADVFEAAAAQQSSLVPCYLSIWEYKSHTQTLPVSVKIHSAPHTAVPRLRPLLTSALADQLAATAALSPGSSVHDSSSSFWQETLGYGDSSIYSNTESDNVLDSELLQMHAVCFAGCVQMLACVFGLKLRLPAAAAAVPNSSSSNSSSSSSDGFRLDPWGLLNAVCRTTAQNAADTNLSGVDVMVGEQLLQVGEGSSSRSSSSGDDIIDRPQLQVMSVEPCCVTAAAAAAGGNHTEQQIRLLLTPSGASQGGSAAANSSNIMMQEEAAKSCRMLVFQQQQLLLDTNVSLEHSAGSVWSVSVSTPPMAPGVVHVALLPGNKQQQQQQDAEGSVGGASTAISTSPSCPLLLLPLLVLPEEAARELELFRRSRAAAAAAVDSSDADAGSATAAAAAAAWEVISALSVDISYLMTAADAAAAAAAAAAGSADIDKLLCAPRPYPEPVRALISHVCKHLAAWGMFSTLQFLVNHMAAAAAAAHIGSVTDHPGGSAGLRQHRVLDAAGRNEQPSMQNAAAAPAGESSSYRAAAAAACDDADSSDKAAFSTPPNSKFEHANMEDPFAATSSSSSDARSSSSCSWPELLCGFRNRSLESHYQAVQYANTYMLEVVTAVYNAFMGTTCWFATGAGTEHFHQKAGGLVWRVMSYLVVLLFNLAMPMAVLVLRRHVQRQVRQQQQQEGEARAQSASSSSKRLTKCSASSSNTGSDALQQPQQQQHEIPTYAQAAGQRKKLMISWLVLVILLDVMCAWRLILVPQMLGKVWGKWDLKQDVNAWIGLGIKGWMYQVPFTWFVVLFGAEVVINVCGMMLYGLRPGYWVLVRCMPAFTVGVCIAATQNITSRKAFLAAHVAQHE